MSLCGLIDRFRGLRVVVVGEAILDTYLEGSSRRLAQEAPVPVVDVAQRIDLPGGAANVAANVAGLGARAELVSVIGDDREGRILMSALGLHSVACDRLICKPERQTLMKTRVCAGPHLLVRFDQGTISPVDGEAESALIDRLAAAVEACDAVIVSDYGYGILTPRVIRLLADVQSRRRRVVVVDSKSLPAYRDLRATAVKPDYRQAARLLGIPDGVARGSRAAAVAACGHRLLEITGARLATVTLDSEGALFFRAGYPPYRTHVRPELDACASGAGDSFTAALTLALAAEAAMSETAEIASTAAAVVLHSRRTAVCFAGALAERLSAQSKYMADRERLNACVEALRIEGRRIVFTNGCFDLLHRGHVAYLNRAKSLGDVLIVAVNSDSSVAALKGPSRPINPLEDRIHVLSGLGCVDLITSFDEDRPDALIAAIRPDLFVKGGDYTMEMIPEAELVERLGGSVAILPYEQDRSTSRVIERIRSAPRALEAAPGRERG